MLGELKKALYFPIAYYFRFFAKIQLSIWKPKIIIVTGSSGKTTCLSLIESQLQDRAKYSHKANSAYGVPFDILGLKRESLLLSEWPCLFLVAPIKAFKTPPRQKLYIVECDCDRPGEGKFLSTLLKPAVTLWLNVSQTHTANFDKLTKTGQYASTHEAISAEFSNFIKYTAHLSVVNADSQLVVDQLPRTKSRVQGITKHNHLKNYQVFLNHTDFEIDGKTYSIKNPVPQDTFYAIAMCIELLKYLQIKPNDPFSKLQFPPGRSSVFTGIKNTVIIDSTYNANLGSMGAILDMFGKIKSDKKWVVLGDMLEQGEGEKQEHEKLAKIISSYELDRVILMGPRISKYTYPKLKSLLGDKIVIEKFTNPKEVLSYLKTNIQGQETILFKGARFLEGVIENILKDRADANKLCRREKIWELRRKKWGL